jgi:hypothetical protein
MPKIRGLAVDPLRLALAPESIDVLLHGWGREHQTDYSSDPRSDGFQCFELNLAEVWRQHRAMLMQEWQRRGEPGTPWGCKFDQGRG